MTTSIFKTQAPRYWEKNLSVFYLEPGEKRPPKGAKGWPGYCNNLPQEKIQKQWLEKYPDHGIGLLTGLEVKPTFRIAAVDVDDDKFVRVTEAVLGNCPCAKRGKKGMTFFVLAEAGLKSTNLKASDNTQKIDILINGKLTVLPPSIHPETQQPYEWQGKELTECNLDELPVLTEKNLGWLERIVKSEHVQTLLTGVTTHDAGVAFAASLVALGCDDDLIQRVFVSLLPLGYEGDSLAELPGWIESARSKGYDKNSSGPLDDRIATLVAEEMNPMVYAPGEGFLRYKEGHWQKFSETALDRLAKKLVLPHLKPTQQVGPYLQNIRKCTALNLEREGFGDYSSKICVKNGTVDVRTGQLLAWAPEHELRYQLPLEFDPDALCPIYEEQVSSTLCGDEKAIATFEEYAGLTLIPDLSFQKALYFVGTGGSGKSTLLKVIESMHCPEGVSVTPLDKIDTERYLTDLARKLICISFDIQTKQSVFGEAFVRITGGDLIATRKLYNEVEGRVKPTVRFIGSMNPDMPNFIASPDALERRLIFLKCGQKVEKPDRQRLEKLLSERSGILNRWIKALQRLIERGEFDLPAESTLEVEEYVNTQDAVQVFVREQLEIDPNACTPANILLSEFNQWAELANERKLSANVLGKKLKAAGIKVDFTSLPTADGERLTVRVYRARFKNEEGRKEY